MDNAQKPLTRHRLFVILNMLGLTANRCKPLFFAYFSGGRQATMVKPSAALIFVSFALNGKKK